MYPTETLFSRQQVAARTGISDDVLGYWMREGLIVGATRDAATPRAHRRFAYVQLHIAAILRQLHSFGANIGAMRAFAALLQRGVDLATETKGGATQGDLTAEDVLALELHADLIDETHLVARDDGDTLSWFAWPRAGGGWNVERREIGLIYYGLPAESAIYLAVSMIVRRLWETETAPEQVAA